MFHAVSITLLTRGYQWSLSIHAAVSYASRVTTLTLVVVAKNHEDLAAFPLDNVRGSVDELVLLVNPGARYGGMGHLGNHALETSRCDVVGMVHADTKFGEGTLRAFAETAGGGQ